MEMEIYRACGGPQGFPQRVSVAGYLGLYFRIQLLCALQDHTELHGFIAGDPGAGLCFSVHALHLVYVLRFQSYIIVSVAEDTVAELCCPTT